MIKKGMKSHPYISLEKHIESLFKYNESFKEYKNSDNSKQQEYDQLEDVIYWHDYGKQNQYFQERILDLEKKIKRKRNQRKDKHAVLSGLKYIERALKGTKEDLENLNMILGHHGKLVSYEMLLDKMYSYIEDDDLLDSLNTIEDIDSENLRDKFMNLEDTYYGISSEFGMKDAIKIREKFSRLVDADRLSAMRKSNFKEEDLIERNFNKEAQYYRLLKNKNEKESKLSKLRKEIKIEENELLKRDSGVFSLVLPTGLGKTLSSIELGEKNKNKIIYVVPYLSIADQTWEVLNDIYKNRDYKGIWDFLVKHDSRLNEKDYYKEDEETNIKDMVTSWRSKIIVTTTVQFFESIISVHSGKLRKLHNTYGATILIDEPQTLPYDKWCFLKKIIEEMSKELKWKVIYMSATPPTMTKDTVSLIKNEEYLFKQLDRTQLKFVGKTYGFKAISDWCDEASRLTRNNNQVLWLLNIEKGARKIYKYAKERIKDREIYFISGKLPSIVRMYKLKMIKEKMAKGEKILVISTQVLEAGVDLDFDGVVRDLAPLPVLLQVAGRLNRRWDREKETVYVLQLIENTVYSDYEFRHTGAVLYNRKNEISEKDYYEACKEYYALCEEMPPSETNEVWEEEFTKLIESSMELIESADYQTVVPCINIEEWFDFLGQNGKYDEESNFKKYFKEITQMEYRDIELVLKDLVDLEERGIRSVNDYKELKDLISYISWFNTSCNRAETFVHDYSKSKQIEEDQKVVMKIDVNLL